MATERTPIAKRALLPAIGAWVVAALYMALLPDRPGGVFGSDKRHLLVACILGFGIGVLHPSLLRLRAAGVALAFSVAAGIAVEWGQSWSSGRRVEVRDVIENSLGLALGLGVALVVVRAVPTRSTVVALTVVFASIVVAVTGSVRTSAPVSHWISCRTARADPDQVARSLAERASAVPFTRRGEPIPTEFGTQRTTDLDAGDLLREVRCRGGFAVSFDATPRPSDRLRPKTIMAVADRSGSNLDVGIDTESLVIRIKVRPGPPQPFVVGKAFKPGRRSRVEITFREQRLTVEIDGSERMVVAPHRPRLIFWSKRYPLHVGNDASGNRGFDGEIADVRITP